MHFPVIKDALMAGKQAFCEKVWCSSRRRWAELRTLVEQRPKRVMQVGL
jgi:predicted dehydrogenase